MTTTVRPARPDDRAALARLRWEWRAGEEGEAGLPLAGFTARFVAWTAATEHSHLAWLAEHDDAPVGMAWLALVVRIPGPGVWHRLAGALQSVFVVPAHRNRGVGGLLVAAAVDEARRRGMDYVSVHPSPRSFPLYRRAGFDAHDGVLELRLRRPGAGAGPGSATVY